MRQEVIFGVIIILIGTSIMPTISGQKLLPDELGTDFCFKTYGSNKTDFFVTFGFATIDGTIDLVVESDFLYRIFVCQNISQATVFGFGSFVDLENPEPNVHFYRHTFTNITVITEETIKN